MSAGHQRGLLAAHSLRPEWLPDSIRIGWVAAWGILQQRFFLYNNRIERLQPGVEIMLHSRSVFSTPYQICLWLGV
jgi:hypothetical protein